ncbi:hypothetical protein MKEN_00312700 [Mycena kentingensis (nom. inval.)]|nr:hypothetical protein MKEN_00312700 [Mycena kentingensis (nom. inval.)]
MDAEIKRRLRSAYIFVLKQPSSRCRPRCFSHRPCRDSRFWLGRMLVNRVVVVVGEEMRRWHRVVMDGHLRSRYRVLPRSPLFRDVSPVKQRRRCSLRHLLASLKLVILAAIVLAILSSRLPSSTPLASLPTRTALGRVLPSGLRPKLRKTPLVDRRIFQQLAELEVEPDPDERPYFSPNEDLQRMPLVTGIPENHSKKSDPEQFHCGLLPCRFLLPLRIGEQESKARLHFAQIIHLAHQLDRTLVLPNVGKSRLGACFKWPVNAYYNLAEYNSTLPSGRPALIKADTFRHWLRSQPARETTGRSVVVSLPAVVEEDPVPAEMALEIRVGTDPTDDLPSCFDHKFDSIDISDYPPLYITATAPFPGLAIHDALKPPILDDEEQDPMVLMLTYDLRNVIFEQPLPPLRYASNLHSLAKEIAPSAPYVAVHWRMETLEPNGLPNCAHALVDTLAELRERQPDLDRVWFASDYPVPLKTIARANNAPENTNSNKSCTFRDAGALHAEAIGIFVNAFAGLDGRLAGMELLELTEQAIIHANVRVGLEAELLRDAGVRGILDKLIASKATVFLAGGMGCAKRSSFTRQIVDMRLPMEADGKMENANIVDYFGSQ